MREDTRESLNNLSKIINALFVPGSLIKPSMDDDFYKIGIGLIEGIGFEAGKLGMYGLTAYMLYKTLLH